MLSRLSIIAGCATTVLLLAPSFVLAAPSGADALYTPWFSGPGYPVYGQLDRPNSDPLRFARQSIASVKQWM